MIKIKFECWWSDPTSINSRVKKQFVLDSDLDDYNFVSSNPDFTIILGKTDWAKIETDKNHTFYISQEPLWSPNEPKDNLHEHCSKIIVADKRYYPEDRNEYIEDLLPMLYAGRGENDHREEWDWSYKLSSKKFSKNKPISIIVKKDYYSTFNSLSRTGLSEIIYEKRTKIAERLSDNNSIDIYGNFWEKNDSNIKGEIWNKHAALDDYYFSLCMENTIQKNYISEKFWDSVLVETIPIYLGCNNIYNYIDENAFIYINGQSLIEIQSSIDRLLNTYHQQYTKRQNEILKLKNLFFTDSRFNLWERVKKLIHEN
jgi:hypothetical protein